MTDIRLTHTRDGGEVEIVNGRVTMDDGPATAVYLSLFGGNERDGGGEATRALQWWGNLLKEDSARGARSETQHLLRSIPAITANLRRIEDAVVRDLAWLTDELGAAVKAEVTIPGLNRIRIRVSIEVDGTTTELAIEEPWTTP